MPTALTSAARLIRSIPGASSLLAFIKASRILQSRPDVAQAIQLSRSSPKPVLVFCCPQPAHRQTIQDLLPPLSAADGRKYTIIVVNGFRPKDRSDVQTPRGIIELDEVPLNILPRFRCAAFIAPFVGLSRHDAPPGAVTVHLLVSITSLDGVYEAHQFDDYDYIVCAGGHQIESFHEWRQARPQLAGKILIRGGYPKLDLAIRSAAGKPAAADGNTIVYAPTHSSPVNGPLASLRDFGPQIVSGLLTAGHKVIFRPHPVSFGNVDAPLVAEIVAAHEGTPAFTLDRSENYVASYSAASLMVTDLSGTGFTYAFTFCRPAVFFSADAKAEEGLRGLQFECREKIGGVARTVPDLIATVRGLLNQTKEVGQQIAAFRDQTVFNLGSSGEYLAGCMGAILQRETCEDWERL